MLYLIGGASRAGKTLVAQELLENYAVPRFSIDYLISALQRGEPELGIHHDNSRSERSKKIWPFLKPLLCNLLHEEPQYLIEGDALSPKLVRELIDENASHVRACFLGYPSADPETKVEAIASFAGRINNWTSGMSQAELARCVEEGLRTSREIKAECEAVDLQFFDMSLNFESGVQLAVNFLLNGNAKEC